MSKIIDVTLDNLRENHVDEAAYLLEIPDGKYSRLKTVKCATHPLSQARFFQSVNNPPRSKVRSFPQIPMRKSDSADQRQRL